MRTRGIMAEKPENNVYMPSEIIENEQGEQALEEKFVTDPQKGLGQKDVENRIAEGKVNGDTNIKTKSVAQILRENIVTFFNFVFIALALLIFFFVDSGESLVSIFGNFGFMLLIIFNALVGIFQEMRAKRTIDKFAGSWAFIFSFTGGLVLWMVINTVLAVRAFDPYPFILLNLVLSCIAAIQAPLIMMSQNRQEEKDRRRAENDYKVNLKTEIMIEDLYDKVNAILAKQSEMEKQLRAKDDGKDTEKPQ